MAWDVLFDDEFEKWYDEQVQEVRDEILAHTEALSVFGPNLGRPRVGTLTGSSMKNMKELRFTHEGKPWRVIFAFDIARSAILLVGGNKAADKRWYKVNIPIAENRFRRHNKTLKERGK